MFLLGEEQISIYRFGNEEFLQRHSKYIRQYAFCRVRGFGPVDSFKRAFAGEIQDVGPYEIEAATNQIEYSRLYQQTFDYLLATTPVEELWSMRDSLDLLLNVVRSPISNCSTAATKLRAASELDELTGARGAVGEVIANASAGRTRTGK